MSFFNASFTASSRPPRLFRLLRTAIALCSLWSGSAGACHPAETAAGVAEGFDAGRLCQVLTEFQAGEANLHGLVIQRHGKLVAERYRTGRDRSVYSVFTRTVEFDAGSRHDLRSVSKSVVGLLWGIAQAEGKTPPLDARVLDLFPELAEFKREGREAITVAHLLSMSSGLEWKEPYQYGLGNDELALYWRASQEKAVLARPMLHPAGTRFHYTGGATAVLATLLARGVGMPLPDYARERLFAPLAIHDWEWMSDLRGRPLAFAGLRMRPYDLAKIGQLVLQRAGPGTAGSWCLRTGSMPRCARMPTSATAAITATSGGWARPGRSAPSSPGRPPSAMAGSGCSWCRGWTWWWPLAPACTTTRTAW